MIGFLRTMKMKMKRKMRTVIYSMKKKTWSSLKFDE